MATLWKQGKYAEVREMQKEMEGLLEGSRAANSKNISKKSDICC